MLIDLGLLTTGPLVALVSAQDQAPPAQGEEFGEASPIALVVIIVLALATVLLIRNMSKRIRRLPESFDEPGASRSRSSDEDPGSSTR